MAERAHKRRRAGISATELKDVLAYGLLLVVIYVACWLAISNGFNYQEPCWSLMVVWVSAHLGGLVFNIVHLPPLLGMLLSGMLLNNMMKDLIVGLSPQWKRQIRAMALGTIFLRSGLELDLQVFKRVGPAAIRLLLIPGLVEAFTAGSLAHGIFNMPIFLGFTMGFILKAVGPAIVIQTMFEVQQAGLGAAKGIPSIVVGAASFDDMVAITGYSLFSSLALNSNKALWETILHGPIDLALGAAAGCIGAIFCSLTVVWDTKLKRLIVVFSTTMVLLYTLYHFDYTGGGALSALVLGMLLTVFWERGIHFFGVPGFMSLGANKHFAMEVEHVIGIFWRFFAQPLLFGIIGTMINFKTMNPSIIPKSLAIVFIGMIVRMPTTFTSMLGAGLTWKERLFIAFSWTPKATVQAALGAQPLDLIRKSKQWPNHSDSEYLEMEQHGEEILTTAVFAVLVCAPIGVMLIHMFARRLLEKDARHNSVAMKDESGDLHIVHSSSFSQGALRPKPSVVNLLNVRETVDAYIHGNESGFRLEPEISGSSSSSTFQQMQNNMHLTMQNSVHNRQNSMLEGDVEGKMTHRDQHVKMEMQMRGVEQGAESDVLPVRPVAESSVTSTSDPHLSVTEQYLASMEVLAEALDTPDISATAPEYSAQLKTAVHNLRMRLLDNPCCVEDGCSAVVSARQFFRRTQAALSLTDIDAAVEQLQGEFSNC